MRRSIPAIPTKYNGRQFRSRLEARWAAFFDLCGWHYDYEPVDLNGWIPDFVIRVSEPIVVEVKPFSELDESTRQKMEQSIAGTDYDQKDLLYLGSTFPSDERLGWLAQYFPNTGYSWGFAQIGMWTPQYGHPERVGFCHEYQSFYDRITGYYEGGSYGALHGRGIEVAKAAWSEAGNRVQWQKMAQREI